MINLSMPAKRWFITVAMFMAMIAASVEAAPRISLNPYETIDWQHYERHHGNFHTHTTESDGTQHPRDVIDRYLAINHRVLALTDHDKNTWPWQKFGRDPDELGMLAIPGNELSRHHHTLSLFSELETSTKDHETAIQEVHGIGGISVLAHPGRYWDLEDGKVPDEVRDKYARLFKNYSSLIGMEVVNQTDRYPRDRALWDALLTELMPERMVWGMANDDSHRESDIGLNTTVLLLPEFTEDAVRASLTNGRYYFTTVTSHPKEAQSRDKTPIIRDVVYDEEAGTLTISADAGVDRESAPLADDRYQWISAGGRVIGNGPTLNLNDAQGLETYVRLEIRGEGGTAYTQPFGIETK